MGFSDRLQQRLGAGSGFMDRLNSRMAEQPIDAGMDDASRELPAFLDYAPPAPAPEESGVWDGLLQSAGETGSDMLRGLNQGLYMGGSDEIEALSPDRTLEQARAANAQAEQRSPWLFTAAKTAGYVPGMFMGPATAAGRLAIGVGQGALGGALSSDSNDPWETAHDALSGGLWGGGLSGAGEAVGALQQARPALESAGKTLRRANIGGTAGELDTLRKTRGIDYMEQGVDEAAQRLGLFDSAVPQSASGVSRKLDQSIIPEEGARLGSALDDATAQGAMGSWQTVDDDLMSFANNPTDAPAASAPTMQQAGELGRIASEELPPWTQAPPRELQAQKVEFEGAGAYPEGTVTMPADNARAGAYRQAAGVVRNELDDTMRQASPDTYAQFNDARSNYQDAQGLSAMAGKRAASNRAGLALGNPSTLAAMGAGITPGAVMGNPLMAAGGAVAGYGANYLARNFGQDAAGIAIGRGMGPLASGVGGAGQAMSMGSGAVGTEASEENSGTPGGTRGFLLPQAALELMRQPGALGKWESEFFDAYQQQDSHALATLITRLSQSDEEFRRTILPQLQQLTGAGY